MTEEVKLFLWNVTVLICCFNHLTLFFDSFQQHFLILQNFIFTLFFVKFLWSYFNTQAQVFKQ